MKLNTRNARRINRVRSKVSGTTDRPRLAVKFTNRKVIAQIINDEKGQTICIAISDGKGSLSEQATTLGKQIATIAKKNKVSKVVLDKRDKKYHTRLRSLCDTARSEGLEF